ncbi:TPA: hypothetical protein KOR49_002331 [Clostridioides difficile]|nr:hypothetical protein [Clostridioides difficile]HBE8980900.1 hypothetical protein [Clostridioides difficile]HBF2384659.1 hypothetical protein [Clostridioides difficile]HBF2825103.1 hypothetical protein [Clostridioides difficile]HBF3307659.1 hypothetical protein [Clostridioides difficile]
MDIMVIVFTLVICIFLGIILIGPRIIGSGEIGIVEKKFSKNFLKEGELIALNGEAGFQADILRTGLHFKNRLFYKVHKKPLVTIKQGQIGYVFARSGESLKNGQILGRAVSCNDFQDTKTFLKNGGQKGPQRVVLREGTYAFNLAEFIILTKNETYFLNIGDKKEIEDIKKMKDELIKKNGFDPIVIDDKEDNLGIVVTKEGKALKQGDLIAPIVGDDENNPDLYHNSFQDIEAFLKAGGYKGRQYEVLTEGVYVINRLFASIEIVPKQEIEISSVGVVCSYIGQKGEDVSGKSYTHGELVEDGCRGILKNPLMPGKYAFNIYSGSIEKIPTDNFALKWRGDECGQYEYDRHLKELSVITKDGFKPLLPLSVVVHIDYKKAPLVIQRFGSVQKLVDQTLDPIISAYFKQVAETKTFLELLQNKTEISQESYKIMKEEFQKFNLELEEVLIDTPKANGDERILALIEQLADRQLAKEQVETYEAKKTASAKEREYRELQSKINEQDNLTSSEVHISIEKNNAEAQKAVAKIKAEQNKIEADSKLYIKEKEVEAEIYRISEKAKAEAESIKALAEAEAQKEEKVGKAIASANREKAKAYGSAELLITKEIAIAVAEAIKEGNVDIVPKNVISNGNMDSCNSLGNLVQLVTLNKLESNEYLKKEKIGNPIDLKEEIINVTEESLQ